MNDKDIIPKLKKKVSDFIYAEKGTIPKQSMVSIGTFVGTLVASGLISSKDVEATAITITSSDDGVYTSVTGSHSHHSNHSNHSNHSSHTSSDLRLKKNIREINNALEKIQNIDGVYFNWKENDERSIGLIAQQVEKNFPELVLTDEYTGLKSVNYPGLIAPLIEAVKNQQKQIQALKDEIETLKRKANLNKK